MPLSRESVWLLKTALSFSAATHCFRMESNLLSAPRLVLWPVSDCVYTGRSCALLLSVIHWLFLMQPLPYRVHICLVRSHSGRTVPAWGGDDPVLWGVMHHLQAVLFLLPPETQGLSLGFHLSNNPSIWDSPYDADNITSTPTSTFRVHVCHWKLIDLFLGW